MQENEVCRACLAVEGKFYSLRDSDTAQMYEQFTGYPVVHDGLPQHVCGWCMRWLRRAADGRMRARVALELLRRHVPRGTAITKQMSKSLSAKCAELKPRCVRSQIFVLDISSGEWGGRRGPEDYCEASYLDDVKEEKADEVHDEEDMEGEACGDTIESANVTPQHGNEISHKKLYLEVKPLDVHYEADDAPEDRAERASNENDKPKLYLEVKPLNVSFKKISEIINCKNKNKAKKVVMKRQIVNRSNAMSKKSITEYARKANFDVRFLTIAEQKKEIEDKLNEVVTLGKKCGKCGKRFRDTNTLERHTKVYHVSRPGNLVCDICECVFNRRTLLKTHLDNHSWVFTCRECGFRTNQQGNMMPHWSFHAGKKFVCQFCNKEYQKRSTFLSHVKLKHSMELPWCRLCGEFSTSQKGVDIHMNVTHGALEEEFPEVCRHCDKRFKSDVALQRHAAVQGCAHSSCAQCGDWFPAETLLQHHLVQRHFPHGDPEHFDCDSCHVRFHNESALARHSCGVSCAACGDSARDAATLATHVRDTHDIFRCAQCGKQFTNSAYFKRHHTLVHTRGSRRAHPAHPHTTREFKSAASGVRSWRAVDDRVSSDRSDRAADRDHRKMLCICEVCGKGYPSPLRLRLHQRTHSARDKFACAECGRLFTTKFNLQMHANTHSGARPFPCSVCGKTFRSYAGLYRHFLVHSGERKHLCAMCNKSFQTSTCVKTHIRTAHLRQPWPPRSRKRKPKLDDAPHAAHADS
ncbi:oocyte zinc finger protein XlCOF6-like isoform X3 [Plodia interpunctella]|uniref:oocyte zinc finger protein XlCOF6-like isoform X3 n=1 Tax=Plodia interpunctella TaxID=58824 RepID=UPI0023679960|nr:oocyte zinc finger protein XlCOF6-like isoform X3 [Plodia interpunctella]